MTEDETPEQTAARHLAEDAAQFFTMKAQSRRDALNADIDDAGRAYLTAYAANAQRAADAYARKARGEMG